MFHPPRKLWKGKSKQKSWRAPDRSSSSWHVLSSSPRSTPWQHTSRDRPPVPSGRPLLVNSSRAAASAAGNGAANCRWELQRSEAAPCSEFWQQQQRSAQRAAPCHESDRPRIETERSPGSHATTPSTAAAWHAARTARTVPGEHGLAHQRHEQHVQVAVRPHRPAARPAGASPARWQVQQPIGPATLHVRGCSPTCRQKLQPALPARCGSQFAGTARFFDSLVTYAFEHPHHRHVEMQMRYADMLRPRLGAPPPLTQPGASTYT